MKLIQALGVTLLAASTACSQSVPRTTPYTRGLLTTTDAIEARAYLGVSLGSATNVAWDSLLSPSGNVDAYFGNRYLSLIVTNEGGVATLSVVNHDSDVLNQTDLLSLQYAGQGGQAPARFLVMTDEIGERYVFTEIGATYELPLSLGGVDPADTGSLNLESGGVIAWESSPAGTDATLTVKPVANSTNDTFRVFGIVTNATAGAPFFTLRPTMNIGDFGTWVAMRVEPVDNTVSASVRSYYEAGPLGRTVFRVAHPGDLFLGDATTLTDTGGDVFLYSGGTNAGVQQSTIQWAARDTALGVRSYAAIDALMLSSTHDAMIGGIDLQVVPTGAAAQLVSVLRISGDTNVYHFGNGTFYGYDGYFSNSITANLLAIGTVTTDNLVHNGGTANRFALLNGGKQFSYSGTSQNLADTLTDELGSSGRIILLSETGDPGANVLLGWDDVDNQYRHVTIGSGLNYTPATHTLTSSGATNLYTGTMWDGTNVTGRANLNFTLPGLTVSDNAGLNATDIGLDPALESIASAGYVEDSLIPTNIVRYVADSIDNYSGAPGVSGLRLNGTAVKLDSSVSVGQVLTLLDSDTVGGSDVLVDTEYKGDTSGTGSTNLYTYSTATNTTFRIKAEVVAAGQTNRATWSMVTSGERTTGSPSLHTQFDASTEQGTDFAGASAIQTNAIFVPSSNDIILQGHGASGDSISWLVRNVQLSVTTNAIAATGGGSFTGEFQETFDDATDYDNAGWTTGGGTAVDPNYTGVVLEGSESLRANVSSSDAYAITPPWTDADTKYGYFRTQGVTVQAFNRIFAEVRLDTSKVMEIRRNSAGTVRITHGATSASTVATMSQGTTYHCWWRYTKGTGSDGVAEFAFSTDGVKPTSGDNYVTITTGTATTQCDRLYIGALTTGSTTDRVFDLVEYDANPIGDDGNDP